MEQLSGQELNAALLAALREADAYMSGTSKVQLSAAELAGDVDVLVTREYVRSKFDELWRLAQHPDEDY